MSTPSLTDEDINRKIAEILGWKFQPSKESGKIGYLISPTYKTTTLWKDGLTGGEPLPNYAGSLDAIHECEKTLVGAQRVKYRLKLMNNSDGPRATFDTVEAALCHATARQRAMAFLEVMSPAKPDSPTEGKARD